MRINADHLIVLICVYPHKSAANFTYAIAVSEYSIMRSSGIIG
jgi:hypothetical protein